MATISSLLADHVSLRIDCVDRLFLHGYVPGLQTQGQVIRFLLDPGFPIPSPAVLGKIGREYVRAMSASSSITRSRSFVSARAIARRSPGSIFAGPEREGRFGVVPVGVAQEKNSAWRGWRDGGSDSHPHFEFAPVDLSQ